MRRGGEVQGASGGVLFGVQFTADIIRDEGSTLGDASDVAAANEGAAMGGGPNLGYTIDHIEARVLNRTAGMRLAFEVSGGKQTAAHSISACIILARLG